MKNQFFIFSFFLLFSCADQVKQRNLSSTEVAEEQPDTILGEYWTDQEMEEAHLTRRVFKEMLEESTGDNPLMKRDAHPKHHGCVEATLNIDPASLNEDQKVGLYSKKGSYQAMIRFSNGDPNHKKADKKSDVRGMAIKIFDAPEENYLESIGLETNDKNIQDLVLMNSSEFFIKDAAHYGRFMSAVSAGSFRTGLFFAGAVLDPDDDFVSILNKARGMKVNNPLDIDYHSATPYRLGDTSMKMMMKTCKIDKDERKRKPKNNFLSTKLAEYLTENSTCYDFYLQPNKDPEINNIENSQLAWSLETSPMIKVGRLEIPKQSSDSIKAREEYCEHSTHNPWRAPETNRPLGQVNRIRLEVYVKQARMRLNYNGRQFPGKRD